MLIVKINGNRDYPIQKKSTYEYFTKKIESLNQRIEELASGERYQEKVKNLVAGTPEHPTQMQSSENSLKQSQTPFDDVAKASLPQCLGMMINLF